MKTPGKAIKARLAFKHVGTQRTDAELRAIAEAIAKNPPKNFPVVHFNFARDVEKPMQMIGDGQMLAVDRLDRVRAAVDHFAKHHEHLTPLQADYLPTARERLNEVYARSIQGHTVTAAATDATAQVEASVIRLAAINKTPSDRTHDEALFVACKRYTDKGEPLPNARRLLAADAVTRALAGRAGLKGDFITAQMAKSIRKKLGANATDDRRAAFSVKYGDETLRARLARYTKQTASKPATTTKPRK